MKNDRTNRKIRGFYAGILKFLGLSVLVHSLLTPASVSRATVIDCTVLNGDIVLHFVGQTSNYYQIWSSVDLMQEEFTLEDLVLGEDGPQSWTDPESGAGASASKFYAEEEIDGQDAQDEDEDGIDTYFELLNELLDPMNGADGALDFDGDGVSNTDEYLRSTDLSDPASANTTLYGDADFGDDAFDALSPVFDGEHGPKVTIQGVVDVAVNGDTMQFAAGIYSGNVVVDKDLTLIPIGSVVLGQ